MSVYSIPNTLFHDIVFHQDSKDAYEVGNEQNNDVSTTAYLVITVSAKLIIIYIPVLKERLVVYVALHSAANFKAVFARFQI